MELIVWRHSLKITFRNLSRNPGFTIISIMVLSLGIACCLLMLLWIQNELSHDQNYGLDNLYRAVIEYDRGDETARSSDTPGLLGPSLEEDFPEIIRTIRVVLIGPLSTFRHETTAFTDRTLAVADSAFLDMLSIKFLHGDPGVAFSDPYNIIITENVAETYFNDVNPMGKMLMRGNDETPYIISGVIENIDPGSHLKFDYLLPFSSLVNNYGATNNWRVQQWFSTYVQLSPGITLRSMADKVYGYLDEKPVRRFSDRPDKKTVNKLYLQPIEDVYFDVDVAGRFVAHGEKKYVYIFSIIAFAVLLISCFNFMLFLTVRSIYRAREIGIKKIIGSSRLQIIFQFLVESFVLSFLGLILALLLVELSLPSFNNLINTNLEPDIFARADSIFGLICFVLIVCLVSGSYPAALISGIRPVMILKNMIVKGKHGVGFRRVLIAGQLALMTFLIFGFIVVNRQIDYMINSDPGFRKEHILYWGSDVVVHAIGDGFKKEVLNNPNVLGVTWTSDIPSIGNPIGKREWTWEGDETADKLRMALIAADADFIDVFGLEMADGPGFQDKEKLTPHSRYVIINEAAVKAMGMDSPVGKQLYDKWGHDFTITGVVKNFHFRSFHHNIEPLVIEYIPDCYMMACIRINPHNITGTTDFILSTLRKFYGSWQSQLHFVDDDYNRVYKVEQQMSKVLLLATSLAFLVSVMGLMGLISFIILQREKEIGIRKVLGASVTGIVRLLTSQIFILVICASIVALPLASYCTSIWLQNFAYRINVDWRYFGFVVIVMLLFSVVATLIQAIRAATANPVKVLRSE